MSKSVKRFLFGSKYVELEHSMEQGNLAALRRQRDDLEVAARIHSAEPRSRHLAAQVLTELSMIKERLGEYPDAEATEQTPKPEVIRQGEGAFGIFAIDGALVIDWSEPQHGESLTIPGSNELIERAGDMQKAIAIQPEQYEAVAAIGHELPAETVVDFELVSTDKTLKELRQFGVDVSVKDMIKERHLNLSIVSQNEYALADWRKSLEESEQLIKDNPYTDDEARRLKAKRSLVAQAQGSIAKGRRGVAECDRELAQGREVLVTAKFDPAAVVRNMIEKSPDPDHFITRTFNTMLEIHQAQQDEAEQQANQTEMLSHILQLGAHWKATEVHKQS